MIGKLLTEHHLEFQSLTEGCRGSYETTLVKLLEISCRGSDKSVYLLNKNIYVDGTQKNHLNETPMRCHQIYPQLLT